MPNVVMIDLLDELILEGKVLRLKIKGNSMMPFLRDGKDMVELAKANDRELLPGAVVLFRFRGSFLLHRIIRREGSYLITMGDGVLIYTERITTDQVVGIVRANICPNGKRIDSNCLLSRYKTWVWMLLKPLRRWLLAVARRVC